MSSQPPVEPVPRDSRETVYSHANRAASLGLGVNIVLVIAKTAGVAATGSASLLADAFNSIGDVASALAVRGALHVAQKEEDDDHPYGHSKAESIAGLSVALVVVLGAGWLAMETVQRFYTEATIISPIAGWVAGACGIVKELTYRYTNKVAIKTGSSALRAAALDHRSDALASGAIAGSLILAPYLGTMAPWIDPIAGVCICGLLITTGARMYASTAAELMDQQADMDVVNQVRSIAAGVEHVTDVEKLRVRKSGLEYFIEIHVEVEGHLTVHEGHRIGHAVKDQLLGEFPRVRDVHVHIEPANH